jgi:hypothetical protein
MSEPTQQQQQEGYKIPLRVLYVWGVEEITCGTLSLPTKPLNKTFRSYTGKYKLFITYIPPYVRQAMYIPYDLPETVVKPAFVFFEKRRNMHTTFAIFAVSHVKSKLLQEPMILLRMVTSMARAITCLPAEIRARFTAMPLNDYVAVKFLSSRIGDIETKAMEKFGKDFEELLQGNRQRAGFISAFINNDLVVQDINDEGLEKVISFINDVRVIDYYGILATHIATTTTAYTALITHFNKMAIIDGLITGILPTYKDSTARLVPSGLSKV